MENKMSFIELLDSQFKVGDIVLLRSISSKDLKKIIFVNEKNFLDFIRGRFSSSTVMKNIKKSVK